MMRDQLEVDVLFVGAGPASLAGALHLARLVERHNRANEQSRKLTELTILVIEKGREIGAHALSGAVVDPIAFDELLDGLEGEEPPYDCPVGEDALYILTQSNAFRSPLTPAPFKNHGNYVASMGRLVRWMAELCERHGVEVYPEFPAVRLLFDGQRVAGVRIGDKGRDRKGKPKANFEAGVDVFAKVTVLGEGPRGSLARQAEHRLGLAREGQPQIYSVGVKEIWQVPAPLDPGQVFHTAGYPIGLSEFGGGFIYSMKDNLLNVGYVIGLDHRDPRSDVHRYFQQYKSHPFVAHLLKNGRVTCYGAKAIPEGGLHAVPRLFADGLLLVGDSAGFLNAQRLKGIHLAIKSGMLAAETILEALLAGDFSSRVLEGYSKRFQESWAHRELWKVRNFRQSFQKGLWGGLYHLALQTLSGGRGVRDPLPILPGHVRMESIRSTTQAEVSEPARLRYDGRLTFDKQTDVYYSNTAHEEDQPCHLKILDTRICQQRCVEEYGNPCQYFCPAHVYEIIQVEDAVRLQLNFTNCVHCKTCDIMDPYQIIVWTPPEGGGGPDYKNM